MNFYADLEKPTLLNMPSLSYYNDDRNELDNSGLVGTILMDLSKAYGCLPHDLIIAKFEAYGLSKSSLNLLLDYLASRKERVKICSSCNLWN